MSPRPDPAGIQRQNLTAPRPSLEQFLAELRRVNPAAYSQTVSRIAVRSRPGDLTEIVQELLRDKRLTSYQAEAICRGEALIFDPYVVLDKIGGGGMGTVYRAFHREDKRRVVALKVLRPTFSGNGAVLVERFRREAESLMRIRHPSVVRCLEPVTEADGEFFLVMEYVRGQDLRTLVQTQRVFPIDQAIDCLLQTAKGLQFAHSSGIIHRDVKPANLMLDRDGKFRILDFGLARIILSDSWIQDDQDETVTGAIMGSVPFMAPEQARDSKRADARSDIYSLGCTLHFLLTGRPPYSGKTWPETFLAHSNDPIPSLQAVRPTVPDQLERLYKRMLAKDPTIRPPTMASVIAAIELAREEARGGPSSATQLVIPLPPEEPDLGPSIEAEDLEDELFWPPRPTEEIFVGPRIDPPAEPVNIRPLIKYLAVATALTAIAILSLKLFL
jgi:serine/threonine protein kinase